MPLNEKIENLIILKLQEYNTDESLVSEIMSNLMKIKSLSPIIL